VPRGRDIEGGGSPARKGAIHGKEGFINCNSKKRKRKKNSELADRSTKRKKDRRSNAKISKTNQLLLTEEFGGRD